MAEVLGLLVSAGHTTRAPASLSYKLIHTMALNQSGAVGVHVCQTAPTPAKFRIAIVENGYAYVDGATPATYQFWIYDKPLEAGSDDYDMVIASLGPGDRIVVWTDTSGVTFCPHGIQV